MNIIEKKVGIGTNQPHKNNAVTVGVKDGTDK